MGGGYCFVQGITCIAAMACSSVPPIILTFTPLPLVIFFWVEAMAGGWVRRCQLVLSSCRFSFLVYLKTSVSCMLVVDMDSGSSIGALLLEFVLRVCRVAPSRLLDEFLHCAYLLCSPRHMYSRRGCFPWTIPICITTSQRHIESLDRPERLDAMFEFGCGAREL